MTLTLPDPVVHDMVGVQRNFEALRRTVGVSAIGYLPALGQAGDGDEITYVADATAGVVWRFKYRASSVSALKWEFIGGPPLLAEVAIVETTASASYVDLATVGPAITVPLAGDYVVDVSSNQFGSASSALNHSYAIGGTGAADADAASTIAQAANVAVRGARGRVKTGLAAGTALVSKYKTSAGTATFYNRELRVLPVRVG